MGSPGRLAAASARSSRAVACSVSAAGSDSSPAARMPPGTAASIRASRESNPRRSSIVATAAAWGPMWRSTNGRAASSSERDWWAGRDASGADRSVTKGLLGSGSIGSPPPLSPVAHGLQSCLIRTVLAPERFRGGIAPSALRSVSVGPRAKTLPCGIVGSPSLADRRGSADLAGGSPRGQLVAGAGLLVLRGALAGQLGERALDLLPDTADGDAEDALPALEQVDDLVVAGALVDRGAVAHQGDAGQVVGAALAQVLDRGADLLQRDARIEEALDDLEDQDVAEGVEPLGAGAGGAAHAGLDEAGAGPVVELAVGDAGRAAGGRSAVARVAGQRGHVVVEEQPLLVRDLGRLARRRLVGRVPRSHVVVACH